MRKHKTEFTEDKFSGIKVNCNHNRPTNEKILALLYVMTYEVSQTLNRPCGFHVRVRFTSRMTASSFSSRITTYYQRKSSYKPLWVCAAETDPGQTDLHYHYALVLDARHDSISSLFYHLGKLQQNGFIYDYHIKGHNDARWGLTLNNPVNLAKYLYWLSYIGKTSTKPLDRQTYSASHSVNAATKKWLEDGKPHLHLTHKSATNTSSQVTLENFLEHGIELTAVGGEY